MALIGWETAEFASWYGATVPDGAGGRKRVGYSRDWATGGGTVSLDTPGGQYAQSADVLESLGLGTADRVLVVGCGYGFGIEVLHGRGFPNVWGVEESAHIATNRGTETVGATLMVDDDIKGGGRVRAALRALTGDDQFDWVVTEFVLESYADGELGQLLDICETGLLGVDLSRCVHFVTVPPFSAEYQGILNEKTIDGWNTVRPAHTWVSDHGEVR